MPDREKVIKGYEKCLRINGGCRECPYWDRTTSNKCERRLKQDALALLKEQQEIVRCKDCKHWDKGHTEECDNSDGVCFHNGWCKPYWFCADGEH